MTAAESQAIAMLNDHLKDFIEENRMGHQDIKDFIKDVEHRLCAKIEAKDKRINEIIEHCKERESQVDALLVRRQQMFELEIATAQQAAVAEATRPSVYTLATRGALEGIGRFALRVGLVVGLISGFFALLDKIFHFWGAG
jgi:hypothetical protein